MAQSSIKVTEGSGKNIGSVSFTRNSETQEAQFTRQTVGSDTAHDFVFGEEASFGTLANVDFSGISGSHTSLFNSGGDSYQIVTVYNDTNEAVILSMDGGTTDHFFLPAFTPFTLDFVANGKQFSGEIQVKESSTTPTSGKVYAGGVKS